MEVFRTSRKTGYGGGAPRGPSRWRRRVPVLVLVACAVLAAFVALDYWSNSGRIYNGVSVAGADVGGKTTAEAEAIVKDRLAQRLGGVRLTGPADVTLTAPQLGVTYDVPATVERAYAVGRGGNVFERLWNRLEAAYGSAEVAPKVGYNRGAVDAGVKAVAQSVDRRPTDATVAVNGSEVNVGESRDGYGVNVPATAANVRNAIEEATGVAPIVGGPVEPAVNTQAARAAAARAREVIGQGTSLTAGQQKWTISPAGIGQSLDFTPGGGELRVSLDQEKLKAAMPEPYQALTVEPREAGYKLNGDRISVTPSQTGRSIDEKTLFADMQTGLFSGKREYRVPVVTAEPKLTTAQAEKLKPTTLLGSYRTNFAVEEQFDTPERVENLKIASNAINGIFLAPGQVFSMNDNVAGLDYKSTLVIVNGQESKADGGGLCQVTSTLYMAVNYAGLDVTERHPHYSQLPYIRPGMDATVWFGDASGGGALDMKFRNTSDGYVLLREYVSDDGFIYADVYGKPSNTKVEMNSKPTYMGNDSSKWNTYQKVTKDGKVVYDGLLHKDEYNALVDEHGKPIPPPEVTVPPVNQ